MNERYSETRMWWVSCIAAFFPLSLMYKQVVLPRSSEIVALPISTPQYLMTVWVHLWGSPVILTHCFQLFLLLSVAVKIPVWLLCPDTRWSTQTWGRSNCEPRKHEANSAHTQENPETSRLLSLLGCYGHGEPCPISSNSPGHFKDSFLQIMQNKGIYLNMWLW